MRYLPILFLFSCTNSEQITLYKLARQGNEICYSIKSPSEIVGKYCLRYIDEKK